MGDGGQSKTSGMKRRGVAWRCSAALEEDLVVVIGRHSLWKTAIGVTASDVLSSETNESLEAREHQRVV